jgi:transcriptional antiterminator NusG
LVEEAMESPWPDELAKVMARSTLCLIPFQSAQTAHESSCPMKVKKEQPKEIQKEESFGTQLEEPQGVELEAELQEVLQEETEEELQEGSQAEDVALPTDLPTPLQPEAQEDEPVEDEAEEKLQAELEELPDEMPEEPEIDDGRAWYVIHSYSGYENKVKKNLEHRIESMGMQDQIFQVVVPTEEEVELRDGQRRTTERRVFPGYILVQMIMNDDSWYVVRNTPGVTGFVGSGTKPVPLRPEEVEKIMKRMEVKAPRIKVGFRLGQKVRVVEGPFEDFMGTVDEINMDKGKVRILVSFFGRETPVELDFLQVEKI